VRDVQFSSSSPHASTKLASTKIIDARNRDAWLKQRWPQSVYLNWEQLSQPGVGSRGSLRESPEQLADDLARAGLHRDDAVLILGDGPSGRGNEGRIAWLLQSLGFKSVRVAVYTTTASGTKPLQLESGPYKPTPVARWKPQPDLRAVITAREFAKLNQARRPLILDVRPARIKDPLPKAFAGFVQHRIDWREFFTADGLPRNDARSTLPPIAQQNGVIVVSFAGLSSSGVTLILREWGYDARNLAEGLSWFLDESSAISEGGE